MAGKATNDATINSDGLVISNYVHPHSVNAGIPVEEIKPPSVGKEFELDEAVLDGKLPFGPDPD